MRRKRSKQISSGCCRDCGYRTATLSVSTCPECGGPVVGISQQPRTRRKLRIPFLSLPQMLYQRAYKWFVFISALDVVLTWFILLLGGSEVNVLADAVIAATGLKGILAYKFCLVVFVVLICEIVGRRRPILGRRLIRLSIVITTIPVVLSILQLIV